MLSINVVLPLVRVCLCAIAESGCCSQGAAAFILYCLGAYHCMPAMLFYSALCQLVDAGV